MFVNYKISFSSFSCLPILGLWVTCSWGCDSRLLGGVIPLRKLSWAPAQTYKVSTQSTICEWNAASCLFLGPSGDKQLPHGTADFLDSSVVKNLPDNERDVGLIPEWGKRHGGGNGNPLQYSCLGNCVDRGAWQAIVHGVIKSQTRLNTQHHHGTGPAFGSSSPPLAPSFSLLKLLCRNPLLISNPFYTSVF